MGMAVFLVVFSVKDDVKIARIIAANDGSGTCANINPHADFGEIYAPHAAHAFEHLGVLLMKMIGAELAQRLAADVLEYVFVRTSVVKAQIVLVSGG